MRNLEIGQENFHTLHAIASTYMLPRHSHVHTNMDNIMNIGQKNPNALQMSNGDQVALSLGDPANEKTWNEVAVYSPEGDMAYSWQIWADGRQELSVATHSPLAPLTEDQQLRLGVDELDVLSVSANDFKVADYLLEKLRPIGDLLVDIESAAKVA